MTECWRCAHGLTLSEKCEACDRELAEEILRRWGKDVADAQKVVEEAEKERAG